MITWPAIGEGGDDEANGDVTAGVTVMRATHDGRRIRSDRECRPCRQLVGDALQSAGAQPVGTRRSRSLRIEGGSPRFGVDMDDTNIVTEVLDDAVSYTKGLLCGPEIIARIKYRGHVARKLTGVAFDQVVKISAGAAVKSSDDKDAGPALLPSPIRREWAVRCARGSEVRAIWRQEPP